MSLNIQTSLILSKYRMCKIHRYKRLIRVLQNLQIDTGGKYIRDTVEMVMSDFNYINGTNCNNNNFHPNSLLPSWGSNNSKTYGRSCINTYKTWDQFSLKRLESLLGVWMCVSQVIMWNWIIRIWISAVL